MSEFSTHKSKDEDGDVKSDQGKSKTESMKRIDIEKIVVNIGVGKSGEPVERAKHALEE
jgi:ribosomal protein L5